MSQYDLVVLVADLDAEQTIKTLLQDRQRSLGLRSIMWNVLRHPDRDPGCYNQAHTFLRSQIDIATKALVVFDHHGSGHDDETVDKIQDDVKEQLVRNGWQTEDVGVVVLSPELESWVWSDSPEVDQVLKWRNRKSGLREWLQANTAYWHKGDPKPHAPKEAFLSALKQTGKRPPAPIFAELARRVSLNRCEDASFRRFKTLLQQWFPITN